MSSSGRGRGSDNDDVVWYLKIVGGVCVVFSILAFIFKMLFSKSDPCPKINPARLKWPPEKKGNCTIL